MVILKYAVRKMPWPGPTSVEQVAGRVLGMKGSKGGVYTGGARPVCLCQVASVCPKPFPVGLGIREMPLCFTYHS